jgi:deoxyribose-phosphate aldolase
MSPADVAVSIDHSILRPQTTRLELDAELANAARLHVFSVCVRPCDVAHSATRLSGTSVEVGTVIGFPHGTTSTAAKVAEVQQALSDGATEFDVVLNIGWLRSSMTDEVTNELAVVVDAAQGHVVKVILETAYLTDDEIVAGCHASEQAGAQFVKTSTGFATQGATVEHIRLMRASVGPQVQVKASGGVRTLDALLQLRQAGATRFGSSNSGAILDEIAQRAASVD